MSAVDEIDRLDGIVPVTPQAVGELVAEIKRLRALMAERKFTAEEMSLGIKFAFGARGAMTKGLDKLLP